MEDIGIFASNSPLSIDAAFLSLADYSIFNKASNIDCKIQIQEAKKIGIKGDLTPKIINLT
ncbi:MAG: hypothetical protein GX638_16880 [Crenarchaeota archaeon]|nr:hypothetical protein [Thermoproteota archaeon]